MDDIQMAQVEAGEDAVVERLRQKGLIPRDDGTWPTVEERQRAESVAIHKRQHLESTLARTFVKMQGERAPAQRQQLWAECIRLASELQKDGDS